jgi:hypothetical protein
MIHRYLNLIFTKMGQVMDIPEISFVKRMSLRYPRDMLTYPKIPKDIRRVGINRVGIPGVGLRSSNQMRLMSCPGKLRIMPEPRPRRQVRPRATAAEPGAASAGTEPSGPGRAQCRRWLSFRVKVPRPAPQPD